MSAPYIDREKQLRSVFVGNIPFEVTESELREKFEQAGPIVNFRLVHDRETGKPKGYGFIEYQDRATADSCVRNLNNVEYNGRPLRVGPAIGNEAAQNENIKALQQALGGMQQESPYGAAVEPNEAPEAISKAVSSLPPEQMFELMKQMKICIQNNPNEARNMLLQNPQLAYALLQAQIVMKIVDPQVAMALLHRERDAAPAVKADEPPKPVVPAAASAPTSPPFKPSGGLLGERPGAPSASAPAQNRMDTRPPGLLDSHGPAPTSSQDRYGHPAGMDPRGPPSGMDPRGPLPGMDPRAGPGSGMDRGPPHRGGMDHRGMDSRGPPASMDPRMDRRPGMDPRGGGGMGGRDPRDMDRRGGHDQDYRRQGPSDYNRDPRDRRSRDGPPAGLLDRPDMRGDMRQSMGGPPSRPGPSSQFSPRQAAMPQQNPPPQGAAGPGAGSDEDKEKAALIMQVLQLTDEQIQQLPPDQRQSILILKQQIAGNR